MFRVGIGNERVQNMIMNDTINLFFNVISITVISNNNSFLVKFDKIASVYFS